MGDAAKYAAGIGSGALSGAAAGSVIGPWGTAIGGVLGGAIGGIGTALSLGGADDEAEKAKRAAAMDQKRQRDEAYGNMLRKQAAMYGMPTDDLEAMMTSRGLNRQQQQRDQQVDQWRQRQSEVSPGEWTQLGLQAASVAGGVYKGLNAPSAAVKPPTSSAYQLEGAPSNYQMAPEGLGSLDSAGAFQLPDPTSTAPMQAAPTSGQFDAGSAFTLPDPETLDPYNKANSRYRFTL